MPDDITNEPHATFDAEPMGSGTSALKVILAVVGVLAVWGVVAMQDNASSAGPVPAVGTYSSDDGGLPLGPIGSAACRDAVSEAQSNIPAAVAEAQSSVDDLIAQHPELGAYAAETKRAIADAAPEVRQSLSDAGHELGC